MTLKEYGAVLTGIVASIFGFDFIWVFSSMDALKGAFAALLIGVLAAVAFAIIVDWKSEPKKPEKAKFIKDEQTSLEYMPMRNGRRS